MSNLYDNFISAMKAADSENKKDIFFQGVEAAMKTAKVTEQASGFFEGVVTELAYANNKHPGWPVDDAVHASAILNEEAGKLTQASIDHTYKHFSAEETSARMKQKALRVAAMALRFYASIPEYKQLKG